MFIGRGKLILIRTKQSMFYIDLASFDDYICFSLSQRALQQNGKSKKGTSAIIVCLTASVSRIATQCRNLLQMHQFQTNVVEAVGKRDAVSVTVNLKLH